MTEPVATGPAALGPSPAGVAGDAGVVDEQLPADLELQDDDQAPDEPADVRSSGPEDNEQLA